MTKHPVFGTIDADCVVVEDESSMLHELEDSVTHEGRPYTVVAINGQMLLLKPKEP